MERARRVRRRKMREKHLAILHPTSSSWDLRRREGKRESLSARARRKTFFLTSAAEAAQGSRQPWLPGWQRAHQT